MTDPDRPLAFTYRRISHQRTAKRGGRRRNVGISLDAQLAESQAYIADQSGWLPDQVFTDILTGGRSDRPDYQRLKARVAAERRAGQPCVIVVVKLDRFGRNLREAVNTWPELQELKVPVHSTREGGLVTREMWNRKAMAAEEELMTASERARHGWAHIQGNGWAHVGKQTYGYTWRDSTDEEADQGAPLAVPEVVEVQKRHLQHAFAMVAGGQSGRAAMRYLAALPESERGGVEFSWRTVQHLLRNPFVAGWRDQHETPGRWPAIIDAETWRKVQLRLQANATGLRTERRRYLLTGVVYCEVCGHSMVGSVVPAKPGLKVRRYRCQGGTAGGQRAVCHHTVSAPAVDAAVLEHVRCTLEGVNRSAEIQQRLPAMWDDLRRPPIDPRAHERERKRLVRHIDEARARGIRLTNLLADGKISQAAYDAAHAEAEQEQRDANLALVAHGEPPAPTLPSWSEVSAELDGWAQVLANADRQRDVVLRLLQRVTPRRVAHAAYQVDPEWTPLGQALRALAGGSRATSL